MFDILDIQIRITKFRQRHHEIWVADFKQIKYAICTSLLL